MMMKRTFAFFCAAAFLAAASIASAQPTANSPDPKTGAEMTGTIKEYTAGTSIVLDQLAPSEPIQFKIDNRVVYVDADGKTVEAPGLSTGQKVRVHFRKIGGDNVADKITIIKD
jgi:hypothetical protein